MGPPLRLHLGHDGHRQCHGLRAPLRDPHEAGAPVARIRDPLDEALPLELVDEEAGGLLGDTGALGESVVRLPSAAIRWKTRACAGVIS